MGLWLEVIGFVKGVGIGKGCYPARSRYYQLTSAGL